MDEYLQQFTQTGEVPDDPYAMRAALGGNEPIRPMVELFKENMDVPSSADANPWKTDDGQQRLSYDPNARQAPMGFGADAGGQQVMGMMPGQEEEGPDEMRDLLLQEAMKNSQASQEYQDGVEQENLDAMKFVRKVGV